MRYWFCPYLKKKKKKNLCPEMLCYAVFPKSHHPLLSPPNKGWGVWVCEVFSTSYFLPSPLPFPFHRHMNALFIWRIPWVLIKKEAASHITLLALPLEDVPHAVLVNRHQPLPPTCSSHTASPPRTSNHCRPPPVTSQGAAGRGWGRRAVLSSRATLQAAGRSEARALLHKLC